MANEEEVNNEITKDEPKKDTGFERIYSTIREIKEKHRESQSQSKAGFSLDNYKIEKVLKDNKLKEIFSMIEPGVYKNSLLNEKYPSSLIKTRNTPIFDKFLNVIRDKKTNNDKLLRYSYDKPRKPRETKNMAHSQVFHSKCYKSVIPNKNSYYKSFTEMIAKKQKKEGINVNKANFNIRRTGELKCIKKYNKEFYSEQMKNFASKLRKIC